MWRSGRPWSPCFGASCPSADDAWPVRCAERLFLIHSAPPTRQLGACAYTLVLQPALLGCRAGASGATRLGGVRSPAYQLDQPGARVFAVARLAAEAVGLDHQPAVGCNAPSGQSTQPTPNLRWQARTAFQCKAQLHRSGNLVHVLPARPRGAHEGFLQIPLVQSEGRGHSNRCQPAYPCAKLSLKALIVLRKRRCAGRSAKTEEQHRSATSRAPLAKACDWD